MYLKYILSRIGAWLVFESFERADHRSRGSCCVATYGDHMAEAAQATAVALITICRGETFKNLWTKP